MNAILGDQAQALMTLKDDLLSIYMKSEDNGELIIDRFNYRRISPEGSGSPEEKIADSKLVNTPRINVLGVGGTDPVYQPLENEDPLERLHQNISKYRSEKGLNDAFHDIERNAKLDLYSKDIATSLAKKAEGDTAIAAAVCSGDLSALEYDSKLSEPNDASLKSEGLINDQSVYAPISVKATLGRYRDFLDALNLPKNEKFKEVLESNKKLRMGLGLATLNTKKGCDDLILHIILTPVDP